MKANKGLVQFLITLGIALLIALLFLISKNSFAAQDQATLFKDLSDAFFTPSVLLLGVGGLVFVGGQGIFNMLSFGVMKVLSLIRSEKFRASQPRTYYDYVMEKAQRKEAPYAHLFWVGLICLALALLFLLLHELKAG